MVFSDDRFCTPFIVSLGFIMSLSPHQRGNVGNIVKQNIEAIEEPAQHSGEDFYNVGAPSLEQTHSSAGGRVDPNLDLQSSAAFKTEKGYQVWGHFQQSAPLKWVHQDPVQTSTWFQGIPNPAKLPQNFGPSLSGIDDTRGHQALHKANHDMDALQQDKMSAGSSVAYSEPSQTLASGMEWERHTMATMHQAQFQALQQGLKTSEPQYQPLRHTMGDSTLQPFPLAFGPTKQSQASGFFQGFHSSSTSQNLGYNEQPKTQQQLMQLQQQQQQQLQHQHQMQQLQKMHQLQQHHQQQQQQQQQQQRLHHMQQQYHSQQKLQGHLQQMHQQQPLQQQLLNLQQPEPFATQAHPQDQRLPRPHQPDDKLLQANSGRLSDQSQSMALQPQSPMNQNPGPGKAGGVAQETQGKPEAPPRRSRRLSKDGVSPPSTQPPKEPAHNGGMGGVHGPSGSVIQSTQRKRRASKEINLETLAQKASEMEFLPAKREDNTPGRQAGMVPLVIPVSVPVRRGHAQMEQAAQWGAERRSPPDAAKQQSVIVARRRSLRNSTSDTFNQDDEREDEKSSDKVKRRPRPEPLVIPSPKSCTFIVPSVYPTITSYQSHLRSPVRLPDNPLALPPYTPPPILSPVREGSGLYFSTFLSSIAAGSQGLPPSSTPKIAPRSFLQSGSSDITPPVLPLIGEATPVSLDPRINIGSEYQAVIPELQNPSLVQQDEHKATLVWLPLPQHKPTPSSEEKVNSLMNLACSSVLCGGGTNVELMHHCLHENNGDVMKTLEHLMMRNPVFSRSHHLANYHYAGSDCWTAEEKCYFNKGILAYRKDFFLVQKLVRTKTVAQCVEFYYTYKKQVKIGRNGALLFGHLDLEERWSEITLKQEETGDAEESKQKREHDSIHFKSVTQTLQASENEGKILVLSNPTIGSINEGTVVKQETQTPPSSAAKPRPESAGRRSKPPSASKSHGEPEGIFPCKKCSRVFYKVKSRSAHMKSHAEQEKKAAAQRQREEEERAAAKARQEAAMAERVEGKDDSGVEESVAEMGQGPEDERDEDWC